MSNITHLFQTRLPGRRGVMMTELIVAAILMIAILSFLVPLALHTGRLWNDTQHYRRAIEELTNQLERLTTLDAESLDASLGELQPSAEIQSALPNPRLTGERIADEHGTRVRLEIVWDRVGNPMPVSLSAWTALPTEEGGP